MVDDCKRTLFGHKATLQEVVDFVCASFLITSAAVSFDRVGVKKWKDTHLGNQFSQLDTLLTVASKAPVGRKCVAPTYSRKVGASNHEARCRKITRIGRVLFFASLYDSRACIGIANTRICAPAQGLSGVFDWRRGDTFGGVDRRAFRL
jgi:hypothetical protein